MSEAIDPPQADRLQLAKDVLVRLRPAVKRDGIALTLMRVDHGSDAIWDEHANEHEGYLAYADAILADLPVLHRDVLGTAHGVLGQAHVWEIRFPHHPLVEWAHKLADAILGDRRRRYLDPSTDPEVDA